MEIGHVGGAQEECAVASHHIVTTIHLEELLPLAFAAESGLQRRKSGTQIW